MSSSRESQELTGKVNYKLKYQLLKRCIKEVVLENAALCDRASEMQHQIVIAQEERKFLWKKFMSVQGNNFTEDLLTNSTANSQPPEQKKQKQRKSSGATPKSRQTVSRSRLKRKPVDKTNLTENT